MTYKSAKSYKYAKKVVSGKVLASKYIVKQAERFLADLERDDLVFDMKWHRKVSVFFSEIICVPELGHPVEMPEPHAFWIEQLHCLRYKDDGRRRFKSAYIQCARKQFKTYYAAANGLFDLIVGTDMNPNIMCGANSRDQALICTDMMGKIIKKSPELKELVTDGQITMHTYKKQVTEIIYETDDKFGRVDAMPRDPGDGGNPSTVVIDELHEAKDLDLLETMNSGMAQRVEPLTMIITSPGKNKDAPCYSVLRKKSIDVLNGTVEDDRHLVIMFELDEESEWDDLAKMEKSNPMIPYSRTLKEYLVERIAEAKAQGGQIEANIKIKNCGIWVDAAEVWLQHEVLISNDHNITEDDLIGMECYTGLDLAKQEDLNAFCLFFPNVRENVHAVKMMYWIPEQKVNDNRDHVDYRKWVQQGFMIKQEGNVADHVKIARDIIAEVKKYQLMSFGYDPKYAIMAVLPMMAEAGYEDQLAPVGQGYALSPAVVQVAEWAKTQQLDLMKNKVLFWNFANTVMRMGEQGDMYPSKKESQNKIDGVSALLTAVNRYLAVNAEMETEFWTMSI